MPCVFCQLAGREDLHVVSTPVAYVIKAINPETGKWKVGAYLVIPRDHTTEGISDWSRQVELLITHLQEQENITIDNVLTNRTRRGGRTIEHPHDWLLDRSVVDGGGPGFYETLMQLDQAKAYSLRLEGELDKSNAQIATLQRDLSAATNRANELDKALSNEMHGHHHAPR